MLKLYYKILFMISGRPRQLPSRIHSHVHSPFGREREDQIYVDVAKVIGVFLQLKL